MVCISHCCAFFFRISHFNDDFFCVYVCCLKFFFYIYSWTGNDATKMNVNEHSNEIQIARKAHLIEALISFIHCLWYSLICNFRSHAYGIKAGTKKNTTATKSQCHLVTGRQLWKDSHSWNFSFWTECTFFLCVLFSIRIMSITWGIHKFP